jgi:hypothetical protein
MAQEQDGYGEPEYYYYIVENLYFHLTSRPCLSRVHVLPGMNSLEII